VEHYVISANSLRSGAVVWLRAVGDAFGWTEDASDASVGDAAQRDAWLAIAEAEARANRVVAPYAVDVAPDGAGGFAHTSVREAVRAGGPTVGNSLAG
jgi:hypothetical protein